MNSIGSSIFLYLILALGLLASGLAQSQMSPEPPRLIVMGDSVAAQSHSWPSWLADEYSDSWNVQSHVQNGRTIRDYAVPRDLNGKPGDVIIYALGINDILQGYSADTYVRPQLEAHMFTLTSHGFQVLLLLPPQLPMANPQAGYEIRYWLNKQAEDRAGVESFDLNEVWEQGLTFDGIHPKPSLSAKISRAIAQRLEQMGE